MNLNELTIQQAADGFRNKKFSVTELVSDCLRAIREKDGELHAYLDVFSEALNEAKKADEMMVGARDLPPLFGIPVAVKDNISVEGKRCTAGSKILAHYTAPYDATAVSKLKNQGAIIIGKTNLDEFAMGSSTENSAFGPTRNPYDLALVPGGSSGGSAAAVAGNLCFGALGSDTGGSIRQPAAFCGIVGFKPTYGRVSRHGLIAMASSLDQIGPLTKTVEDAEIIFETIAGEDEFDATSIRGSFRLSASSYPSQARLTRGGKLNNIRIGVPREYFTAGLNPDVEKNIKSAIKKLEDADMEVKEISLPHLSYALACYYIIVPSEVSANLARYDGIRYGYHSSDVSTLFGVYTKSRAHGFGTEVKRRIMLGTYILSAGYYEAYYLKAQKVRRLIRRDFEKAFEEVDVVAGPTTPTVAFKFGERTGNPVEMYLADLYTAAVNLAGCPAISLPAGTVLSGGVELPVGLQLVGEWFEDGKLLAIAQAAEEVIK